MHEKPDLVPRHSVLDHIASLVVDGVRSSESRRAYKRAVVDFLDWYAKRGEKGLTKAVVQEYRADLERRGLSCSSINLQLSAIRKLAAEAADNGLLPFDLAAGILRVHGARGSGVRIGQWLTREQSEALIRRPDATTLKGKRDRAVIALLIGCGVRRQELASLRFEDIQQRDGRWVMADLLGKGKRVRTVPMPAWAKKTVDEWAAAARLTGGYLMRPVNKADRVVGDRMSAQAVFNIVRGYGIDLRLHIAPHDLRRTYAKLAHKGHAPLEQIQLSLGHASILTTERYLGVRQTLADAPCDHLGLDTSDL